MKRCLLAIMLCGVAMAQSFEVASVRLHQAPLTRIAGYSPSGSRVGYEGWPILLLVMEAYNLKRHEVAFASLPPDADSAYYDIVAKAEGDAPRSRAEFRPMLQALLAERFQLRFHHESREIPVYALVAGKSGPKLKASAPDAEDRVRVGVNGRNQFIEAAKMTMEQLAAEIPTSLGSDRPVVDRTGLSGAYRFRLEATLLSRRDRDPEPGDISIFTTVQEQLGLKLEPQRASIRVLVIDSIAKPSEN